MSAGGSRRIQVEARGRICLFGDHQDYLGFPIIGCPIDRYIQVIGEPNNTGSLVINMPDIGVKRTLNPNMIIDQIEKRDYIVSGLKVMRDEGIQMNLGYDLSIQGNIPMNSGLSSSSALCVAWIKFLASAYSERQFSERDIALLAHRAEVVEHSEPGGTMDQFCIAYQRSIYLQTTEPYNVTVLSQLPGLIIANSGEEKKTLEILRQAKINGLRAMEFLRQRTAIESLESLTLNDISAFENEIGMELWPYLRAAIGNHDITRSALVMLQKESLDFQRIGSLLNDHHAYLRNDLRVSTPELDQLIEAARNAGAFGAKLVGSGGGGCIVALAMGRESEVIEGLYKAGAIEVFAQNENSLSIG